MGKYQFEKPIEMPRGMHYGSDYWIVFSKKVNRLVKLYSMYEYINCLNLEMDPLVEYYCEQPLKVQVNISGKLENTVFDFWVLYKNGNYELQEVKPSSELTGNDKNSLRSQEQIKKQQLWCNKNDFSYKVVSDKELCDGEFIVQNLALLACRIKRYNAQGITLYRNDLIATLLEIEVITIRDLIDMGILPANNELNFLALMYYEGTIFFKNIKSRPIDRNMEVMLCQNE